DLIISTGIPRVVVGCLDPFVKVSGRGVAKLREAGIEVITGVLEAECRKLNKVFMTAHTLLRPFVILKWAQSRDGFMGGIKDGVKVPVKFSSPESAVLVHAMRARYDAVLIGAETALSDKPSLNVRYFSGNNPTVVIVDRSGRAASGCINMKGRVLYYSSEKPLLTNAEWIECSRQATVSDILIDLYKRGITGLLVEGGGTVLNSFIQEDCYDEARVEIAPFYLGDNGATKAPSINCTPYRVEKIADNIILSYQNNHNNSAVL
ncbi:MAG: bifunctional diaminohydroxyphosphoribosylaminopyrimidine deaminase/5-amino-6-(5-phosphoribosylamino)uracil reductase, partial [Paramuribaculum sp.]|nr:bifunctional diaminohydroxyphosphoribosylaminopyrimidine deaminase/5-amino-6-(5-phosphoribosylamino)uracil reductase [Paramuribaculum sp.]